MSPLGKTAVFLALLLAAATALLLQRAQQRQEVPHWRFENHLLNVRKEQRLIVRPMQRGAPWARYTFFPHESTVEPESLDEPLYPAPYVGFGIESSDSGTDWVFRDVGYFAFSLMGGTTVKEWLEEIQLVREVGADGRERFLLRAVYSHETGGQVHYFFDPEHPVPPVGWFRYAVLAHDQPPTVFFAHTAAAGEAGRGR